MCPYNIMSDRRRCGDCGSRSSSVNHNTTAVHGEALNFKRTLLRPVSNHPEIGYLGMYLDKTYPGMPISMRGLHCMVILFKDIGSTTPVPGSYLAPILNMGEYDLDVFLEYHNIDGKMLTYEQATALCIYKSNAAAADQLQQLRHLVLEDICETTVAPSMEPDDSQHLNLSEEIEDLRAMMTPLMELSTELATMINTMNTKLVALEDSADHSTDLV